MGGGPSVRSIAQRLDFARIDRPGVRIPAVMVSGGREFGVFGFEARENRAVRAELQCARCRIEAHAAEVLALVAKTPDITLEEIAAHLKRAHGEIFVVSTISRCLDRNGLTFKKQRTRASRGAPT